MEYIPNTLHNSSSKKFMVEIKRVDENTKLVSTVTYERDSLGLRMVAASTSDTPEKILNFLQKN